VQLLAVAAAAGLAVAGLFPALRRWTTGLLTAGALLLAVAHGLTGAGLGEPASARLAVVRAAGYLLIAAGLPTLRYAGLAVVAPLGAPGAPSGAAASAALLAALAALRTPRGIRAPLCGSLVLSAAAEAAGAQAATSARWAVGVLVLRGLAALLTIVVLGQLARRSVTAKVSMSILAGVVALAVGAVAIAGTAVARSLTRDQARQAENIGSGQHRSLGATRESALQLARIVSICGADTSACARALEELNPAETETLAAVVDRRGRVQVLRQDFRPALDAPGQLDLGQSAAVRQALEGRASAGFEVLLGADPRVIAIGVVPRPDSRDPADTDPRDGVRHQQVGVYAIAIGPDRLRRVQQESSYDATIVVDDVALASTLPPAARDDVTALALQRLEQIDFAVAGRGDDRLTIASSGGRPTATLVPLTRGESADDVVGVVVLSGTARAVQATQEEVLRNLFAVTVAVGVLVGLLSLLLGRRIVDPIRRLTAAASRVRRGDLTASAQVTSRDEVGALSRAFDAMTSSLISSNADLRAAAEVESAVRARLETVLDSMADGLITADERGLVTSVNPLGVALTGVLDSDAVGRPLHEVLVGTDGSGDPLVADGVPRTATGVLEQPGGGRVPVAVAATPLVDGRGWAVVLRDITRDRQVERMKTNFLSNVSHELRTPLTPIKGYAELLRRRSLPREKSDQYAAIILEATDRLERVVDLLVAVAALEAGRVSPQVTRVDPVEFIRRRLDTWCERAPGHRFVHEVGPDTPDVHIDASWVGRAVDELLGNAVKYSDPGSTVTVSARPAGDGFVRLRVRDAGRGIDAARRDALFADFEQGDGSATRQVGGLGLGLAFVRRVADEFDLALHVESVDGAGSTFALDLPAAGG
jgi:PAS domain S-box-containing protein